MLSSHGRRGVSALGLALGLLCGCGDEPQPVVPVTPPGPTEIRVLFIGNSLTYTNDLPALVAGIGQAVDVDVTTQMEAVGGYSLEDHWTTNPGLRDLIVRGNWNFVVLQQGPSALPESRINLVYWTQQFDTLIRQGGARTALYMVWPDYQRFSAFDSVSASYRDAAASVHGIILPAGDAWTAAWRRDGSLTLYGFDGFHPSVAGSYLAALTVFCGLSGRSAINLPLRPAGLQDLLATIADSQLTAMQQAAAEALAIVPEPAGR